MILANRHNFRFLLPILGLEHRERKLHADLIVALPQFLELLLCDVQFAACVEVDRVDEEVRVDVFPVCVCTDQDFIPFVVLSQLQCRRVGGDRVDRFVFRETLHHVVEHRAALLVVEPLGGHKVRVGRFRLTVDPGDQPPAFDLSFLVPHGVAHHGTHAAGGLSSLVVGEADDGHSHHRFRSRIIRTMPQSSENDRYTLSRLTTVTRPMCARVTS